MTSIYPILNPKENPIQLPTHRSIFSLPSTPPGFFSMSKLCSALLLFNSIALFPGQLSLTRELDITPSWMTRQRTTRLLPSILRLNSTTSSSNGENGQVGLGRQRMMWFGCRRRGTKGSRNGRPLELRLGHQTLTQASSPQLMVPSADYLRY